MPKKPHKIMYVVEGLSSGKPRLDRLHVVQRSVGVSFRYRGWTDTVRHVAWYSTSLVGATPESALKKAARYTRVRLPHIRARMKETRQKSEMFSRMYSVWWKSHRALESGLVW